MYPRPLIARFNRCRIQRTVKKRSKGQTTSAAILQAARRVFAERGFDGATVRAIAREAGVDPALVLHYHGSKQRLFVTAIELPSAPEQVVPTLLEGDEAAAGERLLRFMLAAWEGPGRAALLGILRSAASDPTAAEALRGIVAERLVGTLSRSLGRERADL